MMPFLHILTGVVAEAEIKCVSFDGDADRIVYFYIDKGEVTQLFLSESVMRATLSEIVVPVVWCTDCLLACYSFFTSCCHQKVIAIV